MNRDLGRGERGIVPAAIGVIIGGRASSARALEIGAPFFEVAGRPFGLTELLWVVIMLGMGIALLLVRRSERNKARDRAMAAAAAVETSLERAEALLQSDDQAIIVWDRPEASPVVIGALRPEVGVPSEREDLLAIGRWLVPEDVQALEGAVQNLRRNGQPFQMSVTTRADATIDAVGRTMGRRVVVRLRDLTGERREFAELKAQANFLLEEISALRGLTENISYPLWRRSAQGRLMWVNQAYVDAVEASDHDMLIERNIELLNSTTRDGIAKALSEGEAFRDRAVVIIAGKRRLLELIEVPLKNNAGSIGMGFDISDIEVVRGDLARSIEAHERTLDQITAAVAIFGSDHSLQFCNEAYRQLWGLEDEFLDSKPQDGAILDRLRADRKLPEQADFRNWQAEQLQSYNATEPRQDWWHLPGGRTIRVVATPSPQGGVTYVYEDVTEQLNLESRLNALGRVQGETLDHLQEGVAVFGQDGRLRLHNPVFDEIWRLSSQMLEEEPHVSDVVDWCSALYEDGVTWEAIKRAVTDPGQRENLSGRMERPDDSVVDYTLTALPEGLTMLTFVDVTDPARVERALIERAEALEDADRLKSTFVQHVSYELRSPLTAIIGFAEMLSAEAVGSLSERQREYMDHIETSSSALLAIIDDILDLATVDAGIVSLDFDEVEILASVEEATEGIADRLRDENITFDVQIDKDIGSFPGDRNRVRQVLFNLLSNAIRFANEGGRIELRCERDAGWVTFTVSDDGVGIPDDVLPHVFDRFESHGSLAKRRGAGLGLSIVKSFVQLHGGTVEIDSTEGKGTVVTVRFPEAPEVSAEAAE